MAVFSAETNALAAAHSGKQTGEICRGARERGEKSCGAAAEDQERGNQRAKADLSVVEEAADLRTGEAGEARGSSEDLLEDGDQAGKAGLGFLNLSFADGVELAGLRRSDAEVAGIVAIDFQDIDVENQLAARLFEIFDQRGGECDGLRIGAQSDGVIAGIELRASDAGDFADYA